MTPILCPKFLQLFKPLDCFEGPWGPPTIPMIEELKSLVKVPPLVSRETGSLLFSGRGGCDSYWVDEEPGVNGGDPVVPLVEHWRVKNLNKPSALESSTLSR